MYLFTYHNLLNGFFNFRLSYKNLIRGIAMNKTPKQLLAMSIFTAIVSAPSYAKEFSCSYVEGGFADVDVENDGADAFYCDIFRIRCR
jgi:hypothetical protein